MVDPHHMMTFHQIEYGGNPPFPKVFIWWTATITNKINNGGDPPSVIPINYTIAIFLWATN